MVYQIHSAHSVHESGWDIRASDGTGDWRPSASRAARLGTRKQGYRLLQPHHQQGPRMGQHNLRNGLQLQQVAYTLRLQLLALISDAQSIWNAQLGERSSRGGAEGHARV